VTQCDPLRGEKGNEIGVRSRKIERKLKGQGNARRRKGDKMGPFAAHMGGSEKGSLPKRSTGESRDRG